MLRLQSSVDFSRRAVDPQLTFAIIEASREMRYIIILKISKEII
jgi:hypothetical protein